MSQSTVTVSLCALGFSFISTASYATAIQVDFGGRDWLGYQKIDCKTFSSPGIQNSFCGQKVRFVA